MPCLLYLDTCTVQRPLDALRTSAERVECDAIEALLAAVGSGRAVLVWAWPLEIEARDASWVRRRYTRKVRRLAKVRVADERAANARARRLEREPNLTVFDALHLAYAETARALLVTIDRSLRRRATKIPGLRTRAVSPQEALALVDPRRGRGDPRG